MNDQRVKYIFPSEDLGSFFTFDHEILNLNKKNKKINNHA